MRRVGRVTRRMHPRSATQRIHFQPGVIRQNNFAGRVAAILLGFFTCIRCEGRTVFDDWPQAGKIRDFRDFYSKDSCRARKVAQLTRVRSRNQNAFHANDLLASA